MQTTEVDNFPGYPDGVTGPVMMEQLQAQAERFETDVRIGYITEVDFTGPVHRVQVDGKDWVEAHSIIISTGASAKWLGLESEIRLRATHGTLSPFTPEPPCLIVCFVCRVTSASPMPRPSPPSPSSSHVKVLLSRVLSSLCFSCRLSSRCSCSRSRPSTYTHYHLLLCCYDQIK